MTDYHDPNYSVAGLLDDVENVLRFPNNNVGVGNTINAKIRAARDRVDAGETPWLRDRVTELTNRVLREIFGFDADAAHAISTPKESAMPTHAHLRPTVQIKNAYVGQDVSAFTVELLIDGMSAIIAEGCAKRRDPDVPNDEIGFNLALGRALVKIGSQLEDAGLKTSELAYREAQAAEEVHGHDFAFAEKADVVDGERHRKHVDWLNRQITAQGETLKHLERNVDANFATTDRILADKDAEIARLERLRARDKATIKRLSK